MTDSYTIDTQLKTRSNNYELIKITKWSMFLFHRKFFWFLYSKSPEGITMIILWMSPLHKPNKVLRFGSHLNWLSRSDSGKIMLFFFKHVYSSNAQGRHLTKNPFKVKSGPCPKKVQKGEKMWQKLGKKCIGLSSGVFLAGLVGLPERPKQIFYGMIHAIPFLCIARDMFGQLSNSTYE